VWRYRANNYSCFDEQEEETKKRNLLLVEDTKSLRITHVTEKRVTKLTFASLTDEVDDDLILLAADMVGDATAYQIPKTSLSRQPQQRSSPSVLV
jgi:hypothetical protein